MKTRIVILLMLAALSLAIVPAFAQEETPTEDVATLESTATETPTETTTPVPTETSTPEATPVVEPTEVPPEGPVIVDQVNFRLGIVGIFFTVVMLLLGGGGIGYVWGYVRANKDAKDKLELAFESTSPAVQEYIQGLMGTIRDGWTTIDTLVRQVISLGGEVTDNLPNVDGPALDPFRGDITRPRE